MVLSNSTQAYTESLLAGSAFNVGSIGKPSVGTILGTLATVVVVGVMYAGPRCFL